MNNFGVYLINKPVGITSHDVVDYLRKITKERTIGHAGTLDPLASGLMIVAVGREFTKQIANYSKLDKEYIAEATLGATSTTYDIEGVITNYSIQSPPNLPLAGEEQIQSDSPPFGGGVRGGVYKVDLSINEINQTIQSFVGTYDQMPPIFSAKKIKGKKAYDLARSGKPVELKPVSVTISQIELIDYNYPLLKFRVRVSSGTYIRSLIDDIGKKLDTGAYMSGLIRTQIGKYNLSDAIDLYQIKSLTDLHPHQLPLSKGESKGV